MSHLLTFGSSSGSARADAVSMKSAQLSARFAGYSRSCLDLYGKLLLSPRLTISTAGSNCAHLLQRLPRLQSLNAVAPACGMLSPLAVPTLCPLQMPAGKFEDGPHWPFSGTIANMRPISARRQRHRRARTKSLISEFDQRAQPPEQQMIVDSVDPAVTRQVVFRCSVPYCERSFGDSFSLAEHLKKHAGEKRHICPVRTCGRRFSTPGNLSRHKRLHGPIRPLECPVAGCICTFRSENKLSKHMKFHLGNPVHVCSSPGCGKTFSTAGNLNRHIKGHHPELDTRKTKLIAANTNSLPGLDSYDSPTGSDSLLQASEAHNSMMTQLRVPTSPASSVSTLDMGASSPAPSSSCASPCASPMPSLGPLEVTMAPEELDALVSILDETVKMEDVVPNVVLSGSFQDQLQAANPSVLDDMIRFHIDNLQM